MAKREHLRNLLSETGYLMLDSIGTRGDMSLAGEMTGCSPAELRGAGVALLVMARLLELRPGEGPLADESPVPAPASAVSTTLKDVKRQHESRMASAAWTA